MPDLVAAEPRVVSDIRDCYFYHTVDIPGHGCVSGEWDLRTGFKDYLGQVDVQGKRVLDVGAASGFMTFHMEKLGAELVSYDLAPDLPWDLVPYSGADLGPRSAHRRQHLRKLNNSYWFCHRAFQSRARMVHGTIYTVPAEIGMVDIAFLGSILLHVRDPFLALQSVLKLTRETVIIADMIPRRHFLSWLLGWLGSPKMTFLPRGASGQPEDAWWSLSPRLVREFLAVLGFGDSRIHYHTQRFQGSRRLMYTVVGRRTQSLQLAVPATRAA